MKHSRFAAAVVLACACASGCADPSRPAGPVTVKVFVDSDPRGATIVLDGVATSRVTPDTLRDLSDAEHDIGIQLTQSGTVYGSTIHVAKGAIPTSVLLPAVQRCSSAACVNAATTFQTAGTVKYGVSTLGQLFVTAPSSAGLVWPATFHNTYSTIGGPVFAGFPNGATNPVALGMYTFAPEYPVPYSAGRPLSAPTFDPRATTHLLSWVVPPPLFQTAFTVRGLEIEQEVLTAVADAFIIRVVFRNISNKPSYQAIDTRVPLTGITYDNAYLGYAIDADIGVANDDYVTYAPDLNTVFAYDSDFRENTFEIDGQRPGLVGLRLLSSPANTKTVLNNWPISAASLPLDWMQPNANEAFGFTVLARNPTTLLSYSSADTRVGNVSQLTGDYRMSVSAGPVRLQPGDSAVIRVAVMLASPVAGTFVSARDTPPGDPTDASRAIMAVAANLLQKARDVAAFF